MRRVRLSRRTGALGSRPVTPATLGFGYWLRADDVAPGAVSSWAPRLGTGTITQGVGADQPVAVASVAAFGNMPAVQFADTTDKLTVAATYVVPLAPMTVVFCGQITGVSTYFGGQLSASGGRYFRIDSTRIRYEDSTTTTSDALTTSNAGTYGLSVAADKTVRFYVNGVQVGADQTHAALVASGAANTFILGDPTGPGMVGYIADFCTAGVVMSAAQMLAFHADYCAPRYGF